MKLKFPRCRRLLLGLFLVLLLGATRTEDRLHAQSASAITSPAPGSSVNGAVPIIGTATIDTFQRYELYYKMEPSGDDSYIYFDGDTRQVTNGQLGVWQTSDLAPGTYTIRMRVVKADGNYSEDFAPNIMVNQQPVATPTPTETPTETPDAPTETPIPIATPTELVQPTPAAVNVEQPNLGETPVVEPSPTAELVALGENSSNSGGGTTIASSTLANVQTSSAESGTVSNFTQELGTALSMERLRARFMTGVRYTAVIFLIVVAIFVGKRLLEWTISKAG